MGVEVEVAKRMLSVWGRAGIRMSEIKDELQWAKAQAEDARDTLCSPSMSGMPSGHQKRDLSDTMIHLERIADSFARMAEQSAAEMEQLEAIKREMDGVVGHLPCVHQDILRMWYCKGMNSLQIARVAHYSVDRVKHLKSEADRLVARYISVDSLPMAQVDTF